MMVLGRWRQWAVGIVAATMLGGCARMERLPREPHLEPPAAVTRMAEREAMVKTMAGEGTVTLTKQNGQSVRLETAVAAEFPNRIRLRAWKLGQAVFDMTLTPEGVWMLVPEASQREKILPAGAGATKMLRGWASLHSGFYTDPRLTIRDVDARTFYLERPTESGQVIRAEVDRDTLVVRKHTVLDDQRVARFTIEYGDFKVIDGVPWPTRMKATSGDGLIMVKLEEVQINAPMAEGAFVPPARAERLP